MATLAASAVALGASACHGRRRASPWMKFFWLFASNWKVRPSNFISELRTRFGVGNSTGVPARC
jgi:hypothetical protein